MITIPAVVFFIIVMVAIGLGVVGGSIHTKRQANKRLDDMERLARLDLAFYFGRVREGGEPAGPPPRSLLSTFDGGKFETRESLFRTMLWHIYMGHEINA